MDLKTSLNKKDYKVEDLKKETGLKTNEEIVDYIFSYYINNIDEQEDNTYLFKLFNLLSEIFKDYYFVNESKITYNLNEISNKLKAKIKVIPKEKRNTDYCNFLRESLNRFENLSLALHLELLEQYQGDTISLIKYITFNVRNLELLEKLLEAYPYIIFFKDEDDNNIFKLTIKEYLNESLANQNKLKIFYYDEALKLIMNSKKFKMTDKLKKECAHQIDTILNDNKNRNKETSFWINSLKNRISNKEDLSNINIKYGINDEFSEYLKRIDPTYKRERNGKIYERTEIDDFLITVDTEDADILDDAVSVKKLKHSYIVGVHITDPVGFLGENSPLITEASNRVISIYAPRKIIPLFPKEMAKKYLSLEENTKRYANSYYFEIDEEGNVLNYDFLKTIIMPFANLSHNDVIKIYNKNSRRTNINKTIDDLSMVLEILKSKYQKTNIYDIHKLLSRDIVGNRIVGNSLGEQIVEYLMMLANNTVANYFYERHLPFIYRVHVLAHDIEEKLNQIEEVEDLKKLDKDVLNLLMAGYPNSRYDYINLGHAGLKLDAYTHITSPLRRYPDILANKCLDTFYYSNPTDKEAYKMEEMLKEEINHINSKIELADYYIRDSKVKQKKRANTH